ncbi:unnamed protein product [Hermetia illucens]|uniref:Uncharacterized protein n=1 Tax=Hermetia illucens TaxID=343691 RepID=A0A7R8YVJ3_HERIL|nr:unnamed protein product [Hermetia illucens]
MRPQIACDRACRGRSGACLDSNCWRWLIVKFESGGVVFRQIERYIPNQNEKSTLVHRLANRFDHHCIPRGRILRWVVHTRVCTDRVHSWAERFI